MRRLILYWLPALMLLAGVAFIQGGRAVWFGLFGLGIVMLYAVIVKCSRLNVNLLQRKMVHPLYWEGENATVEMAMELRRPKFLQWLVIQQVWEGPGTDDHWVHAKLLFPWFGKTYTYRVNLPKVSRGTYVSKHVRVTTGDLFGIVQKQRIMPMKLMFTALPKPVKWEVRDDKHVLEKGKRSWVPASGRSFDYIREYVYGDPISRIHWKQTARTGKLQLKDVSQYDPEVLYFVLDQPTDDVVRTAAGMWVKVCRQNHRCLIVMSCQGKRFERYASLGALKDGLLWLADCFPAAVPSTKAAPIMIPLEQREKSALYIVTDRMHPGVTRLAPPDYTNVQVIVATSGAHRETLGIFGIRFDVQIVDSQRTHIPAEAGGVFHAGA